MVGKILHTVYPGIVRARSINLISPFALCAVNSRASYNLRVWFNSTDHAAKPRHIINSLYPVVQKRAIFRVTTIIKMLRLCNTFTVRLLENEAS